MKSFLYLTIIFASLLGLWSCNEDTFIEPAQFTTVRGRVLYSVDQSPVASASVKLSPASRVVVTDAAGSFRFDSVVVGSYTLQVTKTGYVTQASTVTLTADASPLLTVLLTDDRTQNRAPTVPTLVSPGVSTTAQSTSLTLKWTATDPNRDSLTYDVLLFKSGSSTPTSSYTGLTVDTLNIANLDYNTTYLWQVIVKDGTNTAVNGPVWSFTTGTVPDYSYVFARRINGVYQIFASNATGTAAQLTRNGSNWRPVVSPNRQQIAFISNISTDLQLYVMNANGSNIQQVTTVPIAGLYETDLSFSWSPDGTQLLYPSNDRLYAVRTDGTGLRVVRSAPSGRIFAGCDWTSQGDRIAARTTGTNVYDNEITTFKTDGSDTKSVYTRRDGRVGNPVFSLTGRQLVFAADSATFMNEQGRQLNSNLYLADLATNGLINLSGTQNTNTGGGGQNSQTNKPPGTNDLDPRFSPNGSTVIFTNTDNTGTGIRSVYTIELNNQNSFTRKLLLTNAEMPYWRQ